MNHIDDIFKNGEHQKELEIRPELWDRVERRLDGDGAHKRQGSMRPWMVAASMTLVITMSALLYLNIDTYEVEDMIVAIEPHFSKEEVADLEKVYWIEPSLFVNPNPSKT